MGAARTTQKVKLFAGSFAGDEASLRKAKDLMERRFGRIDYESPVLHFSHTDYYRDEFGEDLKRQFLGFRRTVSMENICKAKIFTNRLEKGLSKNGRRTLNIDPGYLTLSKVILLTTKDYTHRIYLSKGIYAEVTLHYRGGTFKPWPWTYPDYRTQEYIEIFNTMRNIYRADGGKAC